MKVKRIPWYKQLFRRAKHGNGVLFMDVVLLEDMEYDQLMIFDKVKINYNGHSISAFQPPKVISETF